MINLWLTNKLYDVANNADQILPAVLVQDNVQPETWTAYPDWDKTEVKQQNLYFDQEKLTENQPAKTATVSFSDHLSDEQFAKYRQNFENWRNTILADHASDLSDKRLLFKTQPLANDELLRGAAHLKLKVASNQDHGMLSVMLVDYGTAKRLGVSPTVLARKSISEGYHWREDDLNEFQLTKKTPFKMISKGHINLQNRTANYKTDDLQAGEFYDIEFDLQPTFYHLPQGHQLGLVVYSTDMEMTVRGNEKINYTLDLSECQLTLKTSKY
jgi:Predicted acyl esterases